MDHSTSSCKIKINSKNTPKIYNKTTSTSKTKTKTKTKKHFKYLVLSGGGINCLSFVGCYKYLYDKKQHQYIKYIICSSGGCIIGLCIVLGYTPKEMIKVFRHLLGHQTIKQHIKITVEAISNILNKYGLFDHSALTFIIDTIIKYKFPEKSSSITFDELYNITDKKQTLIVSSVNLNTHTNEYFSRNTHGDMSVGTGFLCSMSFPFIFMPVTYNNNIYVDGGILDIFPYKYVKYIKYCEYITKHKENLLDNIKDNVKDMDNESLKELKKDIRKIKKETIGFCIYGFQSEVNNIFSYGSHIVKLMTFKHLILNDFDEQVNIQTKHINNSKPHIYYIDDEFDFIKFILYDKTLSKKKFYDIITKSYNKIKEKI
jgi:NTE family protein